MQYTNAFFHSAGLTVYDGRREYTISSDREISAEYFSFSTTDEEYYILQKMEHLKNKVTLHEKARFALGIVTGNNKEYISQEKTTENEMILKGSDLCKFRFQPSTNYIVFTPEAFQQVAPTDFYRAPEKLLYRFICNQLVFAYDNKQTLSLNSCNILIPEINGLSIKYVMAVLNSRAAQFYFKKQFNSVKVLRSHIENIPIPFVSTDEQKQIEIAVDELMAMKTEDAVQKQYDFIDSIISGLYHFSEIENDIIKRTCEGENMFLFCK